MTAEIPEAGVDPRKAVQALDNEIRKSLGNIQFQPVD